MAVARFKNRKRVLEGKGSTGICNETMRLKSGTVVSQCADIYN